MRDTTQLHPRLQDLILIFLKRCYEKGYKVKITECFRTVSEQDALYAQGRTKKGSIVTNAKGSSYSSMHQWGVAFDICRNDGKGAYYNNDNWFQKIGEIGKSLGLEWGGNWTSIKDLPHFQLPDWGSTASKLKSQYGTLDKFKKAWSSNFVHKNYGNLSVKETENILKGVSIGATEKKYNYYVRCGRYATKVLAQRKANNVKKKSGYGAKVIKKKDGKYNYYVRCACYSNKTDAEKKVANVKKKTGYSCKIIKY